MSFAINSRPKFPCKNCVAPKRHIGCHDKCGEYLTVKLDNELFLERKRQMDRDAKINPTTQGAMRNMRQP